MMHLFIKSIYNLKYCIMYYEQTFAYCIVH